jgi:DNA-binding PadR family transcriptional regulator
MKLKTTGFAVLGQLAFRNWSAYELIKEMDRNFKYFYPKAESGLYAELKKLEQMGYARSEVKVKGKKGRTVYAITSKGQKVLQEWLETAPEPFRLEFDGLLRVFMARFGSANALKRALESIQREAGKLSELGEQVANEYLRGVAPGQSEILQRAIIFDFLIHYAKLYEDWLKRTQQYLDTISELGDADAKKVAENHFRGIMENLGLSIRENDH